MTRPLPVQKRSELPPIVGMSIFIVKRRVEESEKMAAEDDMRQSSGRCDECAYRKSGAARH